MRASNRRISDDGSSGQYVRARNRLPTFGRLVGAERDLQRAESVFARHRWIGVVADGVEEAANHRQVAALGPGDEYVTRTAILDHLQVLAERVHRDDTAIADHLHR